MEKKVKIEDIVVEGRYRKSFGDLKGLAHSIKTVGLLQAIGITQADNRLIFGERRLRAVKMNGGDSIDCRILDIKDILEAEHAENEFHLSLTLTEKHALAEELEKQAGVNKGGRPRKNPRYDNTGFQKTPTETKNRIAVKAGFSDKQEMGRVDTVIKKGAPELVEAMDKGHIPISTAARIAKENPKEKQVEILKANTRENGRVMAKLPRKSHAVLWNEHMNEILAIVRGVESKFGGAKQMLDSDMWKISTPAEKKRCIQTTVMASEELAELADQMKEYRKENRE